MAKNIHATIELQGTLGELVFVHSTKYDKHVRAARRRTTAAIFGQNRIPAANGR